MAGGTDKRPGAREDCVIIFVEDLIARFSRAAMRRTRPRDCSLSTIPDAVLW